MTGCEVLTRGAGPEVVDLAFIPGIIDEAVVEDD